jgi:hypothetical protein
VSTEATAEDSLPDASPRPVFAGTMFVAEQA